MAVPEASKLECLGRRRPSCFSSWWSEAIFVLCMASSQLMAEYFVSGFMLLAPQLPMLLDLPVEASSWSSNAFTTSVAATLLTLGRLGDIYGGFPVYIGGCIWMMGWSLAAGSTRNIWQFIVCRAMQGLGAAAHLSAGMVLLGTVYRPGPRKNVVFSIYGAMAPVGFFCGILAAGAALEASAPAWYFWTGGVVAAVAASSATASMLTLPYRPPKTDLRMDWIGSIGFACGIAAIICSVTQSTTVWPTPYAYISFALGIIGLSTTMWYEAYVARSPLIPMNLLAIKGMIPLVWALLFGYGTIGIFMYYSSLYFQNVMNIGPLRLIAWYAPMAIGGALLAVAGGALSHVMSGTIMLVVPGIGTVLASLLFVFASAQSSYWTLAFPATICATISIDVMFNVANIFFSTNLPHERQGLAGSVGNLLLYLSISILLAVADIIARCSAGQGERHTYKNVFWYECACSCISLAILVGFVRVGKSTSDYTFEEKEETYSLAETTL